MAIDLNHTIVWCRDSAASAAFLAEMLGLSAPTQWGPFQVVATANGVNLDFMDENVGFIDKTGKISAQHYAFLVSEQEFDEIFDRIRSKELAYWADPAQTQESEINTRDGGRGVYFKDPDGHLLEVITKPYGSGGWNP